MKRPIFLSAVLATALALPAAALTGLLDEIKLVYAPEVGTELTKTATSNYELSLVDMDVTILVNGEEQDAGVPDGIEIVRVQGGTTELVETITAVEDGRVTGLTRHYASVEYKSGETFTGPDGEEQGGENERTSRLADRKVNFKWDGDEEAYVASWPDGDEGDAELLEGLEGDTSLSWLLPDGAVEEGADWELDTEAFLRSMDPFGDLHWEDDDEFQQAFNDAFEENIDLDTFEAKLKGVEDGVATVSFSMEASTTFEVEPPLGDEAPDGLEMSIGFEFTFELEGTLMWDVEAHRAVSFVVEGAVTADERMQQSMSGEMEFEVDQLQSFEGTYSLEYTAE